MGRSLAVLYMVLVVVACGCQGVAEEQQEPLTQAPYELQLAEAEAAWQASSVDAYTMRVRYRHPGWHVQVLDVRVEGGAATISRHSCVPRRSCTVQEVSSHRLTVDHIFQEAITAAATGHVDHLVIHEKYSFPRIISVTGDADSWEVSNFKALE